MAIKSEFKTLVHKQWAKVMHLSIETPTPPTPGLCGAMWGIFMVFEVMVNPWGWGISQDLLSVFIWQSGNEVGI